MKKIISFAFIAVAFYSCCEQIPGGLNLQGGLGFKDSTFVLTTIPTAQPRNVLVEESTGVRCVNCPTAASAIKNLQIATPGRIIVAKNHVGILAAPIDASDPDLRNADASAIDAFLKGAAEGQPSASIDRIPNPVSNSLSHKFNAGNWPTFINQVLSQNALCNINLSKTVTGQQVTLNGEFIFTDSTSQPLSYCVYITESKVKAKQDSVYVENGFPKTVKIPDYKHEEVLRKSITPAIIGVNLPAGLQEKGRVYQKVLTFDIPTNVAVPSNAHIIVFVQNNTTNKVLQVAEINL